MDETARPEPDPVKAGLRARCPHCGEGKLFAGFLTPAKKCDECGLAYDFADSGDGPAVFVIMIIGFIVCGVALWLEVSYGPPLYVHAIVLVPLMLILALPLLRMLKGVMICLTYANKAREARLSGEGSARDEDRP